MRAELLVMAKAPLPGQVKTRLTPPCTPEQAAALAAAALADTLTAVAGARAPTRTVVLDGPPGPWLRPGFALEAQATGAFGHRLAAAFAARTGPALLVAMDTPQLTPGLLDDALDRLERPGTDAVLGPTPDGGYWCIGLDRPCAGAFAGVPMSAPDTFTAQRERLFELGLSTTELEWLDDVDTIADARAVAALAPATSFAAALRDSGHAGDGHEAVA